MNWQQLSAVIQLRWCMSRNQWRKAGALNAVITMFFVMLIVTAGVLSFFVALVGGCFLLPQAQPIHLLILWDVIVTGFLFFWMIGLMAELQRSELLSLDKLLHLPVSLFGAFLLNYLSSLASLNLAVFVPLVLGLNLALVVTHGPAMLLVFPLIAGFLLMITGVTYQFRGWLARLMENKRRRGTVLALVMIFFIGLSQTPNLINLTVMRSVRLNRQQADAERNRQFDALREQVQTGQITPEEFTQRSQELMTAQAATQALHISDSMTQGREWLRLANGVLPVGWLPFGALTLAEGRFLPALFGAAGMFALGMLSLWRSYLGTMRAFTRGGDGGKATRAASESSKRKRKLLLARSIPWLPETVSTVALASLTSAIRSPEGKMMLVMPLMMLGIFGMVLLAGPTGKMPVEAFAPIGMAAMGMLLLGTAQFLFNAFGTDRGGFRTYILMPVKRHQILIGKNLSLLTPMLLVMALLLALLAWGMPHRLSHVVATLIQAGNAFLLACLVGNILSIFVPITMPSGSFRPHNIRVVPALLQFLGTMLLPLTLLPAVVAWGIEIGLGALGNVSGIPIYLLLTVIEAVLCVIVYLAIVREQGKWLQRRETAILEVVAAAAE